MAETELTAMTERFDRIAPPGSMASSNNAETKGQRFVHDEALQK
jgi:hypothetical protein